MKQQPVFLVVDDLEYMRQTFRRVLIEMGVKRVLLAAHGREAMSILQSTPVDVILSDWNMPGMSGLDLLQVIRSMDQHRTTPFVMVTAEADISFVKRAASAGVTDFLIKPFSANALREKINRVLEGQSDLDAFDRSKFVGNSDEILGLPISQIDLPPRSSGSSETILVVDDAAGNIDVMAGLLKGMFKVRAATSGEKALKIAQSKSPPDLILLDIMMPVMDGYEVCRILKGDPATRDIPIIFLSAKGETDDVTEGLELGAVDYVTKPANPKILIARINTHLRMRRAYRELEGQHKLQVQNVLLRENVERINQHDLKNPLSAIISNLSLLREDNVDIATSKELVATATSAANNMLRMIHLNLDLYKMETGQYELSPKKVLPIVLCWQVMSEWRSLSQSRNIKQKLLVNGAVVTRLSRTLPIRLMTEELLCYCLLSNLLKNALEASPEGETVTIEINQADGFLELAIANQGMIPEEMQVRFFEKYTTQGKRGGTGLGTYSAKLIADTLGADILFKTDAVNGTRLSVRFPAEVTDQA